VSVTLPLRKPHAAEKDHTEPHTTTRWVVPSLPCIIAFTVCFLATRSTEYSWWVSTRRARQPYCTNSRYVCGGSSEHVVDAAGRQIRDSECAMVDETTVDSLPSFATGLMLLAFCALGHGVCACSDLTHTHCTTDTTVSSWAR
jgi:hypothetical protein